MARSVDRTAARRCCIDRFAMSSILPGILLQDQDVHHSKLLGFSVAGRLDWRRTWDGGALESATDVRLGADGAVIAAGVRDGNTSVRGSFVLSYRDDGLAADGFE